MTLENKCYGSTDYSTDRLQVVLYVVAYLIGSIFGSNSYDSHGSQWSLPDDFPGVATTAEPDLSPGPVSTLRHGVSVESEPVGFNVNIIGAVCRVPSVIKCS